MANYKRWSEAEVNFIKDHIALMSDAELAEKLSAITGETITYGMVRRQRRKLNVVKTRGRRKKVKDTPVVEQSAIESALPETLQG